MKNVNASSTATPAALSLVLLIANMKPNAIARNATMPITGLPAKKLKPVATPIQAPAIVGSMEIASSR